MLGILEVERSGAISVRPWLRVGTPDFRHNVLIPNIHRLVGLDEIPDMIEDTHRANWRKSLNLVKCEIIFAAGQIDVLRIRTPFDCHSHDLDIELFHEHELTNVECNVPKPERRWSGGHFFFSGNDVLIFSRNVELRSNIFRGPRHLIRAEQVLHSRVHEPPPNRRVVHNNRPVKPS